MERANCKCFLEMKWTFSTTSQTILEMVVGYKLSRKIACFYWLLVHESIPVNGAKMECRQDVPFLCGSRRDCYALFVELWFCYGHMEMNNKIIYQKYPN